MDTLNKELLLQHVENSYDKAVFEPEGLFFYHFFGLSFFYDEEQKVCKINCSVTELMLNSFGSVHGGILAYLADTAIGHLTLRYKEGTYVTLELKTSYLKGAKNGSLTAIARYVKEGKNVLFTECEIYDENLEKICITTGTFYRLQQG